MKFLALRNKIKTNIFTFLDVTKFFFEESNHNIRIQLFRFAKKGLIKQIKKGLYCFEENLIDELDLASFLYKPSYISLETALNNYGMIPDIPQIVTSVSLTTSKTIKTQFGRYSYTKIKPSLFFGFTKIESPNSRTFYSLASREKALLDFFYLRKVNTIVELRLNLEDFDFNQYKKYAKNFPQWVQKIKLN